MYYTATVDCRCGAILFELKFRALLPDMSESKLRSVIRRLGGEDESFQLHCRKCHKNTDISSEDTEIKVVGIATRAITDEKEIRKIFTVNPEYKKYEWELVRMLADSGAILEGRFLVFDDQG